MINPLLALQPPLLWNAVAGAWPLDLATWPLAMVLLALLLLAGTLIGRRIGLHQWGIPEALIAGTLGLAVAPDGLLPLLPPAVIRCWDALPLPLLTLVFGSLLLGKPLPKPAGLWRPLSSQVLMALTLAFGQFLVAGLALLLILQPLLGLAPVMACLIEVSFEGGHGSAAAMGPTYERLGVEGGTALGLAMATVGLLASTVVGGLVVVLARRVGWLSAEPASPTTASGKVSAQASATSVRTDAEGPDDLVEPVASSTALAAVSETPQAGRSTSMGQPADGPAQTTTTRALQQGTPAQTAGSAASFGQRLERWAVNLALAGVAVAIGWGLLEILKAVAMPLGGGVRLVVEAFPVFPLALVGSLLVRWCLERSGTSAWVSGPIQNRIGTVSADLLIAAATACLDLSLLARNWLPLLVLASAGLVWNLAVLLLLGPRLLPAPWFSRGIIEFGQATGVAASGLLLLNMADPTDSGDAITPFSIKQLLLQPLLAGGVITVMAPLAVADWGLPAWTALCALVVALAAGLGLWLGRSHRAAS